MDLPPDVGKHMAGPAGAAMALMFLEGSRLRKVAMFLSGWALSYYFDKDIAAWAGAPVTPTSVCIGLFGYAVADKIFATWTQFDLTGWVKRKTGI